MLVGAVWTVVDAGRMGLAMTYQDPAAWRGASPSFRGSGLRDVASGLKAWNLREASVGMAAVNAHHNAPAVVEDWVARPLEELRSPGAFTSLQGDMRGRRVAVIGHFPGLGSLAETCDLTVLERSPQPGDLPDFAAEYVLPEQDFVLMTGTTLINKTLPRLLELSEAATVVLVGPSVPLVPWWFDLGVDVLAGAVVVDKDQVWNHAQEGGHRGIFDGGALMIDIRRADVR